jgi:hypothetical protein
MRMNAHRAERSKDSQPELEYRKDLCQRPKVT